MRIRSTTITDEGRANRARITAFVATLVGLGLLAWIVTEFGNSQVATGPTGSSFVTDLNGTAALAELVEDRGGQPIRFIAPIEGLDPVGSLLVVAPDPAVPYGPDEVDSIVDFVEEGGRLILAGTIPGELADELLPADLEVGYDANPEAEVLVPLGGVGGTVSNQGVRSIRTDAPHLPLAGDPPVAVAFSRGEGLVVYLSDAQILTNRRIEHNAAWTIGLLGDGPIRFDEVRHGFTATPASENPTSLIAALPDGVRTVALLLVPVLLVGMVVYGRRLGPAEAVTRELAPPRRELVDAVAALMIRTPDPLVAAAPVPHRVRTLLARRAGLAALSPPDELAAAAADLGLDPDDLRRAIAPTGEADLVVAHTVLAALSEREHT